MKKLLIGTTALVAAGSLATVAQAADPIKMGVGGYFQSVMVINDQDDHATSGGANVNTVYFNQEAEIIFNGSTKLDNGVKVGAQVQLEAETQATDQIDETFIYFSGGFGRINIGEENSAPYLMHTGTPAGGLGLNSPNFRFYNRGGNAAATFASTRNQLTSDSNKITYFTPRIGGFQAGISYGSGGATSTGEISAAVGAPADNDAGQWGENIEVGVNFVKKFGGVGVRLSAGYGHGGLEAAGVAPSTVDDDRTEWNVGAQVSVAGFTVGAAYRNDDGGISAANSEINVISAGATYGRGAWKIGLQWIYQQNEGGLVGGVSHEYNAFELGGSYTLGPGVRLVGGLQLHDLDDNVAGDTANDNEVVVFYIGTALSF